VCTLLSYTKRNAVGALPQVQYITSILQATCKRTAITNMSKVSDKLLNGYSALSNTYKNTSSGLYGHTLLILKQLHVLCYIEPIFHVSTSELLDMSSPMPRVHKTTNKEHYNLTDHTPKSKQSKCVANESHIP
jgi:hypothetical protein